LFISCTNSEDRINKFTNIYYDILIAREMYPDTSVGNKKVAEILKSYNYNYKDFQQESMDLFMKDRTAFTKVIDSVRKRAELEINKITNEASKSKDTNQIKKTDKK
jgi:hypothetical protein